MPQPLSAVAGLVLLAIGLAQCRPHPAGTWTWSGFVQALEDHRADIDRMLARPQGQWL